MRRTHAVPVRDLTGVLSGPHDLGSYVDGRLHSILSRMPLVRAPLPESTRSMFTDAAPVGGADRTPVAGRPRPGPAGLAARRRVGRKHPLDPAGGLDRLGVARIGDAADEIGYIFGQNALRADQCKGFWRGYGRGLERAWLDRAAERAAAWEPLTLLGSALYWIDLWSRRIRAEASRATDPSAPKDPDHYLHFAMRYLNRWDRLHQQV